MKVSERQVEDYLCNSRQRFGVEIMGIKEDDYDRLVNGHKIYRQVRLGEYGIADIVSIAKMCNGEIVVDLVELKVCEISACDIDQLCRYMTALREAFGEDVIINGILVGEKTNFKYKHLITWLHENICIASVGIDLKKGLVFSGMQFNNNLKPQGFGVLGDLSDIKKDISEMALCGKHGRH